MVTWIKKTLFSLFFFFEPIWKKGMLFVINGMINKDKGGEKKREIEICSRFQLHRVITININVRPGTKWECEFN